ncbi:glycosyltransferase family 4 protein [Knoellia sp. CPCC 206453]|uniref:glycosyltransferase family 4 protein n=1 Tax=Knoellia pratensis TaxID=3404796 RepID=UPI0036139CD2
MRILHTTDTYAPIVGGIEVLVRALAESQVALGHDVTVLTRTPDRNTMTSPSANIEVCRDPRALASLVAGADVVHGHVSAISPLALRAVEVGARAGVPSVATVHSVWGRAWPLFRATAAARGWNDLPIQWAAVSEVAAGPVRRALGGREVLVVPNAVDTGYWAPTVRTRHTDVVTLVAVMRMVSRKRPLELVNALHRMRALVPDHVAIEAVLVGDGPLLGAVRRRVDRLGISEWVHTPGDVAHPELRDLYRRAEVFIAPATHESFGLAALEARAAGLAVVARSGTGITEFITHEVEGLLADSDPALTEHLARLCRDEATRRRIVLHNHLTRPAFDWSDVRELNAAAYVQAGAVDNLVGRSSNPEPKFAA